MFDTLERMPVWQRLVTWVLVAALIVVGWYYLFFLDSVSAREGAEAGLAKASAEVSRLQKKKENHLEEQRQHEERKASLRDKLEIVPMSPSTIDNLMQTVQQKARQVGMAFNGWNNEKEQRQDVYARLPVKVKAQGSWPQLGEFFRQLAELRKPVSIENISLTVLTNNEESEDLHPALEIEFEAATYRALTAEERGGPSTGRASRRKGGKG
ncbi:MAG: type 4a pilus biogenesis protein PilO [Deltaproteobacteria bacterium]|nr:type 4a pilus biogenesis protein PilO [Deltaproteobacteria bacterium]